MIPSEDLWETINMTEPHEAGLNSVSFRLLAGSSF